MANPNAANNWSANIIWDTPLGTLTAQMTKALQDLEDSGYTVKFLVPFHNAQNAISGYCIWARKGN